MQLRNSRERYGAIPQFLHWGVAGLVVLTWVLGTFGDVIPSGPVRDFAAFFHISAGVAIFALVVVRVIWRMADPPPLSEKTLLGELVEVAAQFSHFALYALLFAAAVVGIVAQFARGDALPLFGLSEIASPWPADRALARASKEAHQVLVHGLMVLACLHAAAAFTHHWILRDRTLVRMIPGAKRSGAASATGRTGAASELP